MVPNIQFDANHDSAPIVSNEQSEHGDQRQQQSSIEVSSPNIQSMERNSHKDYVNVMLTATTYIH